MTDDERGVDAVERWFEMADGDLRSAQVLLELDPPELQQAAFHTQQAGEKYLKALLVEREVEIPHTHDLEYLLDVIADAGLEVESLREAASIVNPYAVAARYPKMSGLAR